MKKKLTYAAALLLVLAVGGYFLVQKLNREIEELAQASLAKNNIETSEVKYNFFSQTLSLKNIKFVYGHKSMKMDNSADEILIKGISKDNFIASAHDDALVCDEIELKNLSSKFFAYDNEEMATTTESIRISNPMLNIKHLLELHKSSPFSEEYFQCFLNIKHNGITINNMKAHAYKGSESQAVIAVKSVVFPPYDGTNLNIAYSGLSLTSSPVNMDIGEILLEGFTVPDAKTLSDFSKTIVRLNELERSGALEDDPQSFIEYEKLSDNLIAHLSKITAKPLDHIKISDISCYLNEIPEFANTPISLKEFSYHFSENEKEISIASKMLDLSIDKEFLKLLASPASAKVLSEKFAESLKLSASSSSTFTKASGEFKNTVTAGVPNLSDVKCQVNGFIANKDKNVFLYNFKDLANEPSIEELFAELDLILLRQIQLSYEDKGLIDFAYQVLSAETGLPKESIRHTTLAELNSIKEMAKETDDKDIADIINTLIQTIDKTGKFFADITFGKNYSLNELLTAQTLPEYTITTKAE